MVVVARWLRARFVSKRKTVKLQPRSNEPDLHTQFESLLDQIWRSEAEWRLWDRLDAAHAQEAARRKRKLSKPSQEAA
jgi:heme-degrading monooxygenase HmoA